MPDNIKQISFSTSSYQSMDGSNFTTAGYDFKFKNGIGAYAGFGTDFDNAGVGVFDLKESNSYTDDGIVGHNVRLRTKYNGDVMSTQVRVSPCTVNIPVGENTSVYVNPHYVGNYDYKAEKWKNGAGIFAGVTQNIGNGVSVSLEGQRYNLQDITDNNGGNWSVNAIISVKLK